MKQRKKGVNKKGDARQTLSAMSAMIQVQKEKDASSNDEGESDVKRAVTMRVVAIEKHDDKRV